jgi:hypothetical protein
MPTSGLSSIDATPVSASVQCVFTMNCRTRAAPRFQDPQSTPDKILTTVLTSALTCGKIILLTRW